MTYSIDQIRQITEGKFLLHTSNHPIEFLLYDSRKLDSAPRTLFFALKAERNDGHFFIKHLYDKGVRNFIISEAVDTTLIPEANVLLVNDSLIALQELAAVHRARYHFPVLGITGSNGKTIVKEWLFQLLEDRYQIIRSPKSYNSQIGVPVSVWQINEQHTLGIFEAGISQPGEMENLEKIIRPEIGILTNIGSAHDEGFSSRKEKLQEKLKLFKNCHKVIFCKELVESTGDSVNKSLFSKNTSRFVWSRESPDADLFIRTVKIVNNQSVITLVYRNEEQEISIPFTDDASVENAISCLSVLIVLETNWDTIKDRMKRLQPVNMRLEMKNGINHCSIINDSYSADLSSLNIALKFLAQQSAGSRTLILSDLLQSGKEEDELYTRIADMLKDHRVDRLIGIGEHISRNLAIKLAESGIRQDYYLRTESFLNRFRPSLFKDETILVKGARTFGFEEIVRLLELKAHQTLLEINLNAISHNLKEYQKLLKPSTKIMAMVKAFAYGSGGIEIAGKLQYHQVDYLGVAYADEGVELRKAGIQLPVMVMNPEESTFGDLIEHHLEPEIYSLALLKNFIAYLKNHGLSHYPVHIELETGMNRLGFSVQEIDELARVIKDTNRVKVQSVFSHLVASEDPGYDEFSNYQFELLKNATGELEQTLGYPIIKHISNSASIIRHPEFEMDMVRLGIGLYGIDSSASTRVKLEPVATLKTTIAQIKQLKKGDTVSYNRKGKIEADSVIATLRIGYADGISRRLGNGAGKVWVKGQLVPIIGSVCMDMIMVDVTGISGIHEGDEVVIFGKELTLEQVAGWAGTIPYEIMTGISQRVKRVYYEE